MCPHPRSPCRCRRQPRRPPGRLLRLCRRCARSSPVTRPDCPELGRARIDALQGLRTRRVVLDVPVEDLADLVVVLGQDDDGQAGSVRDLAALEDVLRSHAYRRVAHLLRLVFAGAAGCPYGAAEAGLGEDPYRLRIAHDLVLAAATAKATDRSDGSLGPIDADQADLHPTARRLPGQPRVGDDLLWRQQLEIGLDLPAREVSVLAAEAADLHGVDAALLDRGQVVARERLDATGQPVGARARRGDAVAVEREQRDRAVVARGGDVDPPGAVDRERAPDGLAVRARTAGVELAGLGRVGRRVGGEAQNAR